jgi:hypothetical protein
LLPPITLDAPPVPLPLPLPLPVPLPPLTGTITFESLAGLLKAARLVALPAEFWFCAGAAVPHFGPVTLPGLTAESWRTNAPGFGGLGSVDSSVKQSEVGTLALKMSGRES